MLHASLRQFGSGGQDLAPGRVSWTQPLPMGCIISMAKPRCSRPGDAPRALFHKGWQSWFVPWPFPNTVVIIPRHLLHLLPLG